MIAIDNSEVKVRADELAEIWWRGKQWAVTSRGIEARDGTYFIAAHRLMESFEEWPWPRQLSEKEWCDIDDFCTAFMVGLVLHGYSKADGDLLRKHFKKLDRHE